MSDKTDYTTLGVEVAAKKDAYPSIYNKADAVIKKKDFWDILSSLSTLISGVIIAIVGLVATNHYNFSQLELRKLELLDKFRPLLISEKPSQREFAYQAFVALDYELLALKLIDVNRDQAGISVVNSLAKSNNETIQSVAVEVQKAFDTSTVVDEIDYFDEWYNSIAEYKLLAIGDSWLRHPITGGLLSKLEFRGQRSIFLELSSPGMSLTSLSKGKFFEKYSKLVSGKKRGYKFDIIFVSAGIEDVLASLDILLTSGENDSTKDFIDADKLNSILDGLENGMRSLVQKRNSSSFNQNTPIFLHTYDYPVSIENGEIFERKSIPSDFRGDIVKSLIDAMTMRMHKVSESEENVIVVDTRGTLHEARHWSSNSIPSSEGNELLAEIINHALVENYRETYRNNKAAK